MYPLLTLAGINSINFLTGFNMIFINGRMFCNSGLAKLLGTVREFLKVYS